GMDINTMNFLIRAKTPADMIAIKDELSSQGIVPIGRFELVEDMVRLNRQTTDQSSSATVIIGCLAFMMVGSVFLITGFMRKKEYAIYKVSGYSTAHLFLINGAEMLSVTAVAIGVMLMTSPLLNIITKGIFGVTILNIKMLSTGCGMILLMGVLAFLSTAITCAKVNAGAVLKSGEQG
ncbi:MAG: macrolide ABC transporter ATP-binding protein/permease, partial [Eubacterium sp.]